MAYITKTASGYVLRSKWYKPTYRDAAHTRRSSPYPGEPTFVTWQNAEYGRWKKLRDLALSGERLDVFASPQLLWTAKCYFPETLPQLEFTEAAE